MIRTPAPWAGCSIRTTEARLGILPILLLVASPFIGAVAAFAAVCLTERTDDVAVTKCPSCETLAGIFLGIPMLGRVLAGGRCPACHKHIPRLYPIVEIGSVIIAGSAVVLTGGWLLVVTCVLGWALLVLLASDVRAMLLPDAITLPLIPAGLAASYALPGMQLLDHIIGAAAGGGTLWLVRRSYRWLRNRDGLGLGDVKLFAAAGAWLGWQPLAFVMLAASILAIIAVLIARIFGGLRATSQTRVPFGAALAVAIYATWLALNGGFV
jgi:leader peptidase (prepilin peptidase) / N-methyltransferase